MEINDLKTIENAHCNARESNVSTDYIIAFHLSTLYCCFNSGTVRYVALFADSINQVNR
jgi:hypothetical protein